MGDIDSIILELQQRSEAIERAIAALRGIQGAMPGVKRRGRPPGTKNHQPAAPKQRGRKRQLSPEGRQRIVEATKKRWAAVRAAKQSG